jgi:hypothetical protein
MQNLIVKSEGNRPVVRLKRISKEVKYVYVCACVRACVCIMRLCTGFNWLRIGSSEHIQYTYAHGDNIVEPLVWGYVLTT